MLSSTCRIRSGSPAASIIVPVKARSTDRPGQNEAEYQRYVAFVAADPRVQPFVEWMQSLFPNSTFDIDANPCSRYWTPGTLADVSMGLHIRHPDGSNMLSYAGGGANVATALKHARHAVEDLAERVVSEAIARAIGFDLGFPMRRWRDDAWTVEPAADGEFV